MAAGSTRGILSCRSCSRWRWSASSGSSSTRTDQGFVNGLLGNGHRLARRQPDQPVGDHGRRQLAPHRLHHDLYLAGLKSVDPSLREAAALDGASEWQTFRSVVFPALRPINIVVLVVTVIESLRAFDIVYVINKGTQRPGAALGAGHQQHPG